MKPQVLLALMILSITPLLAQVEKEHLHASTYELTTA
jgi:hypothetical protein